VTSLNRLLSNRYPLFLARSVLGTVLIFASIEKIVAPEAFAISVEAYRIVPFPLINLFALFVPWLELLCGVFLLAGHHVRGSALISSVLLAAFALAIISAMARRLNIDCGCFGAAYQAPVGWTRVLEDLGLLLLGGYVFRCAPGGIPAVAAGDPPAGPGPSGQGE
jgi:putative oxidoreductase